MPRKRAKIPPQDTAHLYFKGTKELRQITKTFMQLDKVKSRTRVRRLAEESVESLEELKGEQSIRHKRMGSIIEYLKVKQGKLSDKQTLYFRAWIAAARRKRIIKSKQAKKLYELLP